MPITTVDEKTPNIAYLLTREKVFSTAAGAVLNTNNNRSKTAETDSYYLTPTNLLQLTAISGKSETRLNPVFV